MAITKIKFLAHRNVFTNSDLFPKWSANPKTESLPRLPTLFLLLCLTRVNFNRSIRLQKRFVISASLK